MSHKTETPTHTENGTSKPPGNNTNAADTSGARVPTTPYSQDPCEDPQWQNPPQLPPSPESPEDPHVTAVKDESPEFQSHVHQSLHLLNTTRVAVFVPQQATLEVYIYRCERTCMSQWPLQTCMTFHARQIAGTPAGGNVLPSALTAVP